MDKIMAVLDADRSGDIDDNEWVRNLKKLPLLNKVGAAVHRNGRVLFARNFT